MVWVPSLGTAESGSMVPISYFAPEASAMFGLSGHPVIFSCGNWEYNSRAVGLLDIQVDMIPNVL